jgi:hypothetical protein
MSDAVLFVLVFGGLFVLRGVAATVVFLWILPDGIRCPQCDAETLRMEPGRVLRLLRRFRASWCLVCGWRGVHRIVPAQASSTRARQEAKGSESAAHPGYVDGDAPR